MMRTLSLLLFALAFVACSGPNERLDGGNDAGADARVDVDAGPEELIAHATAERYAIVGEEVELDASMSRGASRYLWRFGDGEGWDEARTTPKALHAYASAGRYRAVVTVSDELGRRRVASVLVNVTESIVHRPRQSERVHTWAERGQVGVVVPDANQIAVFSSLDAPAFLRRFDVCESPRSLTHFDRHWVVVCPTSGELMLIDPESAATQVLAMPYGSQPFGVVADESRLYVALAATGELAVVEYAGEELSLVRRLPAVADARSLALLPDGRVALSRFRSPDERAEIAVLPADAGETELWTLAYDPQPGSDTESGGVPTYLGPLLVSPTATNAFVASLQAAIGEGLFLSPRRLTFETTVRAVVSFVDLPSGEESFEERFQFDNRGFASAAVMSSHGDYLFVAMRGSRAVERFDLLGQTHAGTIPEVGFAPSGLALSGDDRWLFVEAELSRELVVYDVSDAGALPTEFARFDLVEEEPLEEEVLRGKILFNDSADERLSRDSYIACAHCHLDGLSDNRTWDFTDRGEGIRNTTGLLNSTHEGHGPLHWSANFDELQDFEHDMREPFGGLGLMADEVFHVGSRDTPLGDPKAGFNADLDSLAAFVASLSQRPFSPFRGPDGNLTEAGVRGRAIFVASDCGDCHLGPELSDSGWLPDGTPRLHDVGTLREGSGSRLGGELVGIDTPTLHGIWQSAPYLHDGSAPTLRNVLTTSNAADRHGRTSHLSESELDDLVAYLLQLDGRVD